jgi:uncharacterized protein YggE
MRAQESTTLLDRAARAFQERALAATRAFGYTAYSIRHVTVGNAGQSSSPRPMMMRASVSDMAAAPLPIESGPITLSLTVTGSLQLRK